MLFFFFSRRYHFHGLNILSSAKNTIPIVRIKYVHHSIIPRSAAVHAIKMHRNAIGKNILWIFGFLIYFFIIFTQTLSVLQYLSTELQALLIQVSSSTGTLLLPEGPDFRQDREFQPPAQFYWLLPPPKLVRLSKYVLPESQNSLSSLPSLHRNEYRFLSWT